MARAIWTGAVTFGLVNVPVSLYSGEARQEQLSFSMLDKRDMSPIGYRKVNKKTGDEVPKGDVVRAYEYEKGQFVVLDEEDFKKASPERTQRIEIKAFVDAAAIDPAYFEKPYYLEPAAKSGKVYALLREVMKRQGKIGIATVVIRAKEYLAALIPRGAMLELCLLRYPHELADPEDLKLPEEDPKKLRLSEGELKMAERLVQDLSAPWKPEDFRDAYRDELMEFIRKKASAGKAVEVQVPKAPKAPEAPADIMALLKQSVAHAEKSKTPADGRSGRAGRRLLH